MLRAKERMNTPKTIYTFKIEPCGGVYRALLDHALKTCPYFLLALQHVTIPKGGNARAAEGHFSRYLIKNEMRSEWPGTQLLAGYADVYTYAFTPESNRSIQDKTRNLFDWLYPDFLEDLSLLRHDYSPWLVSITHEKDVWLKLSKEEYAQLISEVPQIKDMLVANYLQ